MADRNESHPRMTLQAQFGEFVELDAGEGNPVAYRIMAELTVGGKRYAVLQSDAMRREGDIEIFRIAASGSGEPELETVESDEEWERAAEAYDDLQFGSDEQP